ncbi:Holliday junction resolvase RuvX [Gammaproteobacteria bacterium]|jgi:putative Holliday junction resolvase|nr:Holliday junction resolvase RuvX [Gammaproteobacteria bacterium]|tara:strand:- start:297 stop:689 length:393 start_codon:yes stop_codon:yes gene_type:complete
MQIVAFDYGTKKIGVAVGQTETYTSSPLQIIYNDHEKTNWNEIRMLIDEWKPDLILIGKPINMDGTESEIMKKVDNFFKKLQKISNTKCEYIDERLTTFEAKEILGESKVAEVDAHAAKILIDNWFERSK